MDWGGEAAVADEAEEVLAVALTAARAAAALRFASSTCLRIFSMSTAPPMELEAGWAVRGG